MVEVPREEAALQVARQEVGQPEWTTVPLEVVLTAVKTWLPLLPKLTMLQTTLTTCSTTIPLAACALQTTALELVTTRPPRLLPTQASRRGTSLQALTKPRIALIAITIPVRSDHSDRTSPMFYHHFEVEHEYTKITYIDRTTYVRLKLLIGD